MDIDKKKKYIVLIQEIYQDLQKTDILDRLEDINAVMTFEYYEESDGEYEVIPIINSIPLGYIYDKQYFTNPKRLFDKSKILNEQLGKQEYIIYMKSLSTSLNEYSLNGIFDKFQIFMADDIRTIAIRDSNDCYILFLKQLNIFIDKIKILEIKETDDPRGSYSEDHIIFEQNIVFKEIDNLLLKTISPLNKNIKEQVWFEHLCKESQNLIIAGENLIANSTVELSEQNKQHYDLSSFLLPFVKAIECEIPHLVERYLDKLIYLATEIIQITKRINVTTNYKSAVSISKSLLYNRDKVHKINSISSLYKIIHFFGFIENLGIIENAKSIFEPNVMEHLRKEKRIIEELKHLGEDRNNFIHAELITQLSEFRLHYDRLYLILEFLAMFKQLSKQTN